MSDLMTRLAQGEILVIDGAMGTMLQSRGYNPGEAPEIWTLNNPDVLRGIHQEYIDAGADIIIANTLGGNRPKSAKYNLDDRLTELNAGNVAIALEVAAAADRPIYVASDMGTTGEFMAPLGTMTEEQMIDIFAEQAEALLKAGTDFIFIETMMDINEAVAAVKGCYKASSDALVWASMSYNKGRRGKGNRTMMGNSPLDCAKLLVDAGVQVIGANCGNILSQDMPEVVTELKEGGAPYVVIEPNAGVPQIIDGKTVFSQSAEDLAAGIPAIIEAGANVVGGCCGTTPEHIAVVARAAGR